MPFISIQLSTQPMDLPTEIQAEFDKAEQAHQRGNEGQARVCARRAAGIAARDYLMRLGLKIQTSSAYDLLKLIEEDAGVSTDLRACAARLTLRVDEEFRLPAGVDLIAEARRLCDELLTDGAPTS
jgi:HEPN domain-containing protein